MTDTLDQLRVAVRADSFDHGLAIRPALGKHPDLDQLVVVQGAIDFTQHGFGQAPGTGLDQGVEIMRQAAQLAFFCFGKRH